MPDEKKERRTTGWWVGWVGIPALIVGGSTAAIVSGANTNAVGAVAAGSATLVSLGYILWRRFH